MKILLFILLSLAVSNLSAQYYGEERISSESLTPWITDSLVEYSRTYHFGFSEGECELRIFVDGDIFAAQRDCYTWRKSLNRFVDTFYTFVNVRIDGSKFYSDESNGEFMVLSRGNNMTAGLLLYQPWTHQFYEGGEFGSVLPDDNSVYLLGDYPEASKRLLAKEELQKLKTEELRRMRNEIFARYGYRFQEGGEMDKYFKRKDWYQAKYNDVDQWLTEIERINIKTIKTVENGRNGS